MAIQILPREQSFGASIGSILGSGLGQGLSQLANNKVQEIQLAKKAKAWESIGVPSNYANFIVQQPEWLQKELVSRLEGLGGEGGQPQQMQQNAQGQQVIPSQDQRADLQPPSVGNQVRIGQSASQKKEAADKFKETKKYREGILNAHKAARSDLKDLGRLEELSKSGELSTPGYIEFLKRSGLDIPGLSNPSSEEFTKIQANFLRNAKQYFGGRISNFEVEQFLKTIPSLSQSPEGRQRVIANLKYVAHGAEEYYKAYEEVLRENRGVPPYDVEEQVERKVDKRADALYERFKKDLTKPVPKGQNKLITALQAGAGSAIKPAGTALAGAALGSVVPGVGTALGGIAGAGLGLGGKLAGLI